MTPATLAAWRRVTAAAHALLDAVDEALLTTAHDPAPALPASMPTQVGQASEPTSPQAAPQGSASEALARPDVEPAATVHAGEVAEPATPEPSPAVDTFATSARGPVPGGADAPAAQTTAAANDEADRHAPQADARALAPSTKRRYRRWTDADSAELRRLAATHCLGDVARLMDRHETSLKPWAQRLGVTFARHVRPARATTARPAGPTSATTATDNPCTVDECDTTTASTATTPAHEEPAPDTLECPEPSDDAASDTRAPTTPATTATMEPATTATRAPLPKGELRRRLLAELALGARHVDDLYPACGTTRASAELTCNAMVRQGVLERCAAATWRIAGVEPAPEPEPAPAADPATSMSPPPSKPVRRPGRKGSRRSVTLPAKRLSRAEIAAGIQLVDADTARRPRTRGECVHGPRPCPWVACAHHLALDVDPETGSLKVNFPAALDGDLSGMVETCALDVADRDGVTLEVVADAIGLTCERVRQVEEIALVKVREGGEMSVDDARGLGHEEAA